MDAANIAENQRLIAQIFMFISCFLAIATISLKSRSIVCRQQDIPHFSIWIIIVCVWVIVSRSLQLMDVWVYNPVGLARGEPITISLLAVIMARGLWEQR